MTAVPGVAAVAAVNPLPAVNTPQAIDESRYDVVGIGLGPFNLSLAALAEPLRENHGLRALFLDDKPEFSWHPGMMIDGARLQVPFLADLVSLTDPTSRYSVLNWLRDTDRLYSFYFAEDLFLERREYEAYCRWVANQLPSCRFGSAVTEVWLDGDEFEVCHTAANGSSSSVRAANVVLGIGTEPSIPAGLRDIDACHSSDYLSNCERLRDLPDVTVVGSGQSGAEVVLDLLRNGCDGQRVRWLTRTAAFEPMEYSKLGLEHFTPDYTRYFHGLTADARTALLNVQGRLHRAISTETITELHSELHARTFGGDTGVTLMPDTAVVGGSQAADGALVLDCSQARQSMDFRVRTAGLVLATGYRHRAPRFLAPISGLLRRDDRGRLDVALDHRVPIRGSGAGLYVQNAEIHTHGVGAPDLGLGAHRAAVILNALTGREVYRLPTRAAHTSFDVRVAADSDPGILLPGQEFPRPRASAPASAPIRIEEAADAPDVVTHSTV